MGGSRAEGTPAGGTQRAGAEPWAGLSRAALRRPRSERRERGTGPTMAALALIPLFVVLLAGPAAAATDTTPGGSAFVGFPIALAILAIVATVFALVVRNRKQKRDDD